ncbi:putative spc97 spc98 family protein [Diaporthe ampelina]|uniref:Spindle pole body component n=1 Tax=Diaporthe ampelina TaxID=1214573 RepID=A0A0G2I223_9PEZI|nr:putative spc97 spc98 family protein [Diaporthe ampelina]
MVQDDKLLQVFGKDEQDLQQTVLASIANLDRPIETKETWNQFSEILRANLFNSQEKQESMAAKFSPHWSLLPLLSFGPMVYAQARLINRECLRLLFSEHGLRKHLTLQRAFQLFGNGMFSSRLANALFNPDMDTTERRSGVSRSGVTMGLRLSSRENWPPASSELRLALMGVLTESYQQESDGDKHGLPGDLSFSIRDLSTEEMEKCMDQGSLEALDFLRMSYKPPQTLAPVITPASLVKYDQIFKLMLRVLRMLFVVDQLFRDIVLKTSHWANLDDVCVRFRVEAHHFVTKIARYFFDIGIDQTWRHFQAWLDKIEKGLQDNGFDKSSAIVSPKRLGDEHERTLDDMAQALLLRKRQQPVLKLLEEIFTQILRFAKQSRLRAPSDDDSGEIKKIYKTFREKVEIFITVCRGMGEKAGSRNDREAGGRSQVSALAMLVLMLDMSNYYTKR